METVELQKVYITGLGAVTPHALTWDGSQGTWARTLAGEIVIRSIKPQYSKDLMPRTAKGNVIHAAFVSDEFNPEKHMLGKIANRRGRCTHLFAAATAEGMAKAGLEPFPKLEPRDDRPERPLNIAAARRFISVGMGIGDGVNVAHYQTRLLEKQIFDPTAALKVEPEQAATTQAQKWNFQGAAKGEISACASGTTAIIDGARKIRNGEADIVIVGGVDSLVQFPVAFAFYHATGALASFEDDEVDPYFASMPYSPRRRGFVLSEGAGMLVLESERHIKDRGGEDRVLAELAGWGETNDADKDTEPSVRGQAMAMIQALRMAGVHPEEVDYINGHGTGTPVGDPREITSIYVVRKNNVSGLYLSGTKSMRGHGIAATGAIEAMEAVNSIVCGAIPPTPNHDEEMEIEADLVRDWNLPHNYNGISIPKYVVHRPVRIAQSNSFGFGGNNTSIVFRAFWGFLA